MGKKKPIRINETLDRVILDSSERVFYFAKKKLKHRKYVTLLVLIAAGVGLIFYSLLVKANILNFYPSSCLGTWDSPQNAQGEPLLGPNAKPEEFNKDNSAFYDGGGAKQIFCGDFRSNGDETEKILKKAILRFTWAIVSPTPMPVIEQSDFENNILDLAPDKEIIVVPDGSLPDAASESGEAVIPDLGPLTSPSPLEIISPTALPSPTPEATPEPTKEPIPPTTEPTPENPPQPEPPVSLLGRFMLANIFSDVASDSVVPSASPAPASVSQPFVEPGSSPEISVSPSPSFTPTPASSPSFTPFVSLPPSIPQLSPSPSLEPASASYSLDDFLEVFYTTDGQNWQSLGRVNKNNFENFELEVPIASWEELGKLQISVTGVFTTDASQKVYLDGMRIEAQYEEIQKKMKLETKELIKKEAQKLPQTKIDKSKVIRQPENKKDFRADEEPVFEIDTNFAVPASLSATPSPSVSPTPTPPTSKAKGSIFLTWFEKLLKPRLARAQLNDQILVEVFDLNGHETDIQPIVESVNGRTMTRLPKSRAFKPGKHELRVLIIKNDEVYLTSQDFTWGVLAINPDKSIYLPGETANLAFAVLDENGKMVCDADLELTLDIPGNLQEILSVSNGRIKVNPECQIKAITYKPDYEAQYQVSMPGTYSIKLKAVTKNGAWVINDSFEVRESVAFDIQRITATRIFPVNAYKVTFNIKANRDHRGKVSEFVPASFTIAEISDGGRMSEKRGEKEISWDVDFRAGQSYSLSYTYFSPTISPQFYLLGPLKIGQFEEIRKWQIAVDDTIDSGDGQLVYSDGAKASYVGYNYDQTFGAFASISASTIVPIFVDNEASPVSNEHMAAILNSAGVLQMLRWDGTTWTLEWTENNVQTAINTGSMDGAYENSGEYVITWSSGLTTTELEYRRWTGSAWVASASYDVSSNGAAVTWVRMASSPASGSYQNDLGVCYVSASTTTSVGCSVWNGTTNAWGNNKLMESNAGEGTAVGNLDTSDLFYEQSSGRLIAVWGIELAGTEDATEPQLGFDIFNPATGWAATSSFTYDKGSDKEEPSSLKCAPMPTVSTTVKNNAICGGADAATDDLSIFAWDGATNEFPTGTAAWNVDTSVVADATGKIRIAATWLIDGANAVGVLVWGSGTAAIEYARYINGTGWQATPQTFTPVSTATTDNNQVLFSNPRLKSRGILLVNDGNQDVFAYSLNLSGTTVTLANLNDGSAITKETGVTAGQPMALAYETIILEQVHYRWRNDDGDLLTATDISAEDIAASGSEAFNIGTIYRLRFEISEEAATSSNDQWRLEFTRKGASCTSLADGWSWQQMPVTPTVASDAFDIEESPNFTDGDATGNNSGGDGGILTDANPTFVAGQAKDTASEISAPGITLAPQNFTELEFAFKPSSYANTSATYCFRLTRAGSTDKMTYTVYPETTVTSPADVQQIHYRWRNDNGDEIDTGDGADGALAPSGLFDLNSSTTGSRTRADGIAYRVSAPSDSATSVTGFDTTDTDDDDFEGIAAGDEVLIINMGGTSGDNADAGNYEFMEVQSVNTGTRTLTFTSAITKSYDGTTASNQKVVVQRIPNYTSVTISSTASISASAWDGLTVAPSDSAAAGRQSGIAAFRATGAITINSGGRLNVSRRGYVYGNGGDAVNSNGYQAESYGGAGVKSTTNNLGGGGGGGIAVPGGDSCGGGGGGGGYGTAGTAENFPSSCGSGAQNNAGATYGVADLSKIFLGSGGGGGGEDNNSGIPGGIGGAGGGIIIVFGNAITVSGTLEARGADGLESADTGDNGAGGGGSGGSIYLAANSVTLGNSLVQAVGGAGGPNDLSPTWKGLGGDGGTGRIRVETGSVTSVTTDPAASLSANAPAGATFAFAQDAKYTSPDLAKNTIVRIRFELSNEGGGSPAATHQLQVAENATCTSGVYSAVPTDTSGHWQVVGSTYITDGNPTANIHVGGIQALTDESSTFVAGELKDTGNTTGSITLGGNKFTEIEFSIKALDAATDGGNYCFELTNVDTYAVIPEITVEAGALTFTIDAGETLEFGTAQPGPSNRVYTTPCTNKCTTRLKVNVSSGGYIISAGRKRASPATTLASSAATSINISDTGGGINVFDGLGASCTDGTGPAVWVSGASTGLGFTLWAANINKETVCWGSGSSETDSLNRYAALPASVGASNFLSTTTSVPNPSYASVGWSLSVTTSQQATTYTGQVIFTATTNP